MRVTLFGQARARAPLILTGSTAGAGGALPATPRARTSPVLPIRDLTCCCRCSLSAPERTNNGGVVAREAAASGRRTGGEAQGQFVDRRRGRVGHDRAVDWRGPIRCSGHLPCALQGCRVLNSRHAKAFVAGETTSIPPCSSLCGC